MCAKTFKNLGKTTNKVTRLARVNNIINHIINQ